MGKDDRRNVPSATCGASRRASALMVLRVVDPRKAPLRSAHMRPSLSPSISFLPIAIVAVQGAVYTGQDGYFTGSRFVCVFVSSVWTDRVNRLSVKMICILYEKTNYSYIYMLSKGKMIYSTT